MTVHDEGLEGLRVLITGGTRGMGEATAKRFAAAGAQVLVVSRGAPPEGFRRRSSPPIYAASKASPS